MKLAKYLASAAVVCVLGAPAAFADSLIYAPVVNTTNPYSADLSQVTASTADDLTLVVGPTAPNPPDGLTVGDDIHILQRAFGGDGTGAFGASVNDNFLFDLVFPNPSVTSARATQSITVDIFPQNFEPVGMENVTMSLFVDGDGDGIGGTAGDTLLASVSPAGSTTDSFSAGFLATGLEAGVAYLMQVTGKLLDDVELGSYRLELTTQAQVIPIPPAILLLATAFGALFGASRLRRKPTA